MSYTDAATKKSGIKTVPASYLYNGSGGSSIDTSYLSDYIKYVNIFNNLAEIKGSSNLMTYLSEINQINSVAPSASSVFSSMTYWNTETDMRVENNAYVNLNMLYLAGKAGKYIDLSGKLKYFHNYDEYLANKSIIDNTYIGVVHGIKDITDVRVSYNNTVMPGIDETSMIQLAIGKLSDVFGKADESPIQLYSSYFFNIYYDHYVRGSLNISWACLEQPKTTYKLIDYMHSSQLAIEV